MDVLLRWLSRRRPWQVLAIVLIILLIGGPLSASTTQPLLPVLSAALAVAVMFGYPILVIFGFPTPYSTPLRRRITLCSSLLLSVAVLASVLAPSVRLDVPDWLRFAFGVPLTALIFVPFFIATAIVDDARRALGQYLAGDFISTWLGIFSYPLFGVFFVQRRVAMALAALDAKPPPAHGGAIAV